eukprot:SAG22_NODE_698_length_7809_cov_2.743061_2_plen_352_part_00
MFVGTNEGGTAFGASLHGKPLSYAGSYLDFGGIPDAIDVISFDLYTGASCSDQYRRTDAGACSGGYHILGDDMCGKGDGCCMLRECESSEVMPWMRQRILPLLKGNQSAWVVPGLFGSGAGSPASDGSFCCPAAGNFSTQQGGLIVELDNYWHAIASEPRITGMFPWHWHYYNTTDPGSKGSYYCKYAMGIKQFPQLVARLAQLGNAFKSVGAAANTTTSTHVHSAEKHDVISDAVAPGLKTDDATFKAPPSPALYAAYFGVASNNTDNTAALQRAIDAAQAQGRRLLLGAGRYTLHSTVFVGCFNNAEAGRCQNAAAHPLQMVGEGVDNTVLVTDDNQRQAVITMYSGRK